MLNLLPGVEGATGAVQQPGFNAGIVSQIKSGGGERGAPPPTVTRDYMADKVKCTKPSTLRASSRQWDGEPDHFLSVEATTLKTY